MKSIDYLKSKNIEFKTIHLREVPKTAKDVERLYGCPLHQVLKTLVFVGKNKPVIAIVPGDKRIDINKLKKVTNQNDIKMANPSEVQEITGYNIGGVTPFGIAEDIVKIIDESVFKIEKVNIGSGKAEIGIELNSEDLKKLWDGIIAAIVE